MGLLPVGSCVPGRRLLRILEGILDLRGVMAVKYHSMLVGLSM